MLDSLRDGPATASMLARDLGESSGATSYHLRALEAAELVIEDLSRRKGRERWWMRNPARSGLISSVPADDAEYGAALAQLESVILSRDEEALNRYLAARRALQRGVAGDGVHRRLARVRDPRGGRGALGPGRPVAERPPPAGVGAAEGRRADATSPTARSRSSRRTAKTRAAARSRTPASRRVGGRRSTPGRARSARTSARSSPRRGTAPSPGSGAPAGRPPCTGAGRRAARGGPGRASAACSARRRPCRP